MTSIDKNAPPTLTEVELFLDKTNFQLPLGFIEFYERANGAHIASDDEYVILWPLTDLFHLNMEYNVSEYAPGFFIFGSNGGDTAYTIHRESGYIFEMPFIGMSNEEAVFLSKSFDEFIRLFDDE